MTGERPRRRLELAYVGVEVDDPDALGGFLTDVIGLVPGEPTTEGDATWRNDERAQRIVVRRGPANDVVAVGFEAPSASAFAAATDRLARGRVRRRRGLARPSGRRAGSSASPTRSRPGACGSSWSTAWPTPARRSRRRWCRAGSSPRESASATSSWPRPRSTRPTGSSPRGRPRADRLAGDRVGPGVELEVRFFHGNGRHHSLAVARAPFELPQTLHHVMVEARDRDDVGRAFDRAWNAEVAIANGLGLHDNDGMFSFYAVTPAGFQVEFGTAPAWSATTGRRSALRPHQPVGAPTGAPR